MFTFKSLFCGAGGDITGMIEAGGQLVMGCNHWERAIETVSSNYPYADFLQADINHLDMRRLPPTDVLWASVICTEISPAGGNRKPKGQQALALEEFGHVPSAAYERTRACALDVIRATEVHRYKIVVVENVVEFARDWELYDWWIEGMCKLRPGYTAQVLCADSAHLSGPGNAPSPQWRGRIYVVFTRKGIPAPDLSMRPTSYCPTCDGLVEGVQWWKRTDRRLVGKYGPGGQYLYRCSVAGCGAVVEPLVLPAAHIIDWSNLGERIGDRKKPLAATTMARVEWGLNTHARPVVATVAGNTHERGSYRVWPADGSPLMARVGTAEDALACPPLVSAQSSHIRPMPAATSPMATVTTGNHADLIVPPLVVNASHDDNRVFPADAAPLPSRTVKNGEMVVVPPLVGAQRANSRPQPAGSWPMATVHTGNAAELIVPPGSFVVKNYGGNARPEHLTFDPTTLPLGTLTSKDHHALVIPYRRGKAKTTDDPLHTLSTIDSAALCSIEIDPMDCTYRMLTPFEHKLGQRFHATYEMKGNLGEQTMLAGNAVSVNAGHHIGRAIAVSLA